MRVIGITGGIGAGKTTILEYMKDNYNCRVVFSDNVAHEVQLPGTPCYERIVGLLGKDVLIDGEYGNPINRGSMASIIFNHNDLLQKVNQIVHPAVKKRILNIMEEEREKNELDFLFIEAALLVEEGYTEICDELWYIYADEDARRCRLRSSRGYADEKIDKVFREQLKEAEFRKNCKVVIDNSRGLEYSIEQIDKKLEGYLCQG